MSALALPTFVEPSFLQISIALSIVAISVGMWKSRRGSRGKKQGGAEHYRRRWEGEEQAEDEPENTAVDWELICASVPQGPANTYKTRPFPGGPYFVITNKNLGEVSVVAGTSALRVVFEIAGIDVASESHRTLKNWVRFGNAEGESKYMKDGVTQANPSVVKYATLEPALNFANLARMTLNPPEESDRPWDEPGEPRRASLLVLYLAKDGLA